MKFGIQMFTAEGKLTPPEFARAVEGTGFDAVSFPDHTHLPQLTNSLYPPAPGKQPPAFYGEIFETFTALAAAAVVTTKVAIGSAVLVLPQRDAIVTAKQAASVDKLSGGRLRLGIGAGWSADEMANHGVDFADRHLAMREKVEAMRAIWSGAAVEYHGRTVDFTPIRSGPLPAQAGGPPIYVSGEGRRTYQRVLRYGDGWMFRARDLLPLGLGERVREFRHECEAAGRGRLPIIALDTAHQSTDLETYAAADVEEVIFVIRPGDASSVSADLARLGAMIGATGLRN